MSRALVIFFLLSLHMHAGVAPVDSLRRVVSNSSYDSARADALNQLAFYEQNFQKGLELAEQALRIARNAGYDHGVADSYFEMANLYLSNSNSPMALHFFLEALKVYEQRRIRSGTAASYLAIGLIYQDQSDFENALVYMRRAEAAAPTDVPAADLQYGTALLYSNYGEVFHQLGRRDSALQYFQRSFEHFMASDRKYQMNLALNGLGDVQFDLGNTDLAVSYYREALRNGMEFDDTLGMSASYLGLAKLFNAGGQLDSSMFYGEKAMRFARKANVLHNIIESGKLLSKLYQGKNDAAALRFLQESQTANDSLYNRQRMAQVQNMFINEKEREEEKAAQALADAERRHNYIEYSAIGIFIVTFIILFLLLSRSIVVNEKMISFLGVLGLLVVFEFINLVIHPSLAHLTHESPVLLLLAYVIVASVLIPIHHRLEKKILSTVIEKNKKIRLENARKTIRELEEKEEAKKPVVPVTTKQAEKK